MDDIFEMVLERRIVQRWRQRRTAINRRLLRDSSNPLSLDDKLFIKSYRVSKQVFVSLCDVLKDRLKAPQRCTSVSTEIKILTTLNFLATGSYQKPTGRDWIAPLSQPVISRCIEEVVEALNAILPTYIYFPEMEQEKNKIKQGFYEKYGFPGVLGCVDGTLVAIAAPRNHQSEPAFFCRKGYHAINAAVICDSNMKIMGINARFGGAAHDSYVWNSWSISSHLEAAHQNGQTGWFLADSGYPQRPWLMTPILHAAENTPEAHYTNMHVRTRVCIEQCIGLLKARWRCLLRHRVLHYKPTKCAKIINACAVLHNFCLDGGNIIDVEDGSLGDYDDHIHPTPAGYVDSTRQQLVNNLWQNR